MKKKKSEEISLRAHTLTHTHRHTEDKSAACTRFYSSTILYVYGADIIDVDYTVVSYRHAYYKLYVISTGT